MTKVKKRLTVGVLTAYHPYQGSSPNPFATPILRGIQQAAADQDVDLLLACGILRAVGESAHRNGEQRVSDSTR